MEHTHEYDCIVCGAHFDRQQDLSRHNEKEHVQKGGGMERPRTSDPDSEGDERGAPNYEP